MAMGITAYRSTVGLCDLERAFLYKLRGNFNDEVTWLAYADWLEEEGRQIEALEARAKTSKYQIIYRAVSAKDPSRQLTRPFGRLDMLLKALQRIIEDYEYNPDDVVITVTLSERRPMPALVKTYKELKDYTRPKPGRQDKKI